MIPKIDVSPLYDGPCAARDAADATLTESAGQIGFMTVHGLPNDCLSAARRKVLLSIFDLEDAEKRKLTRQSFAPENANVYRGWFPLQNGHPTYKEGIDLGADLIDTARFHDPSDPLTEHTPLPDLPEWEAAARAYYRDMSSLGLVLMRGLARGLGLPEDVFERAFEQQNSTLRMIRYPPRPEESFGKDAENLWVEHEGKRRYMLGAPHIDSGFVTLLAQDGVEGLQARMRTGDWVTVPLEEGALAVNFGKLLQRWTGGAIQATIHRVIGDGTERFSIPFFLEPSVNAVISHIPGCGAPFAPVLYGDHVWEATVRFVEQRGIAHLRQPKGSGAAS